MILITETFLKILSKTKSVGIGNIEIEIKKHKSGLNNFKNLGDFKGRKVFKGYLLSKKVRVLVLFQEKNGNYMPFYIVKKESKDGWNISTDSLDFLETKILDCLKDLENGDFEILE